jgi:alanine-glyoxylate transaminase/serine-glyoxylate transaminase/serine-pyruvate transaminase
MKILNMSCGQTDYHPYVLKALGRQIEGPIYYPPYWKLELDTIELLRQLLGTRNDILLITGTGTCGIEAALMSVLQPGEKAIVANCGMYGQVLVDVVGIIGGEAIMLEAPAGEAINAGTIRNALLADPEIAVVAVVHCDTNTGVRTAIDEIGPMLAEEFPDKLFMVDAISSLGATPIKIDAWGIDLCCSSTQKCLNAPQGVAIVSVSERAWKKISERGHPIPTLCLDLMVWKDYHDGVKEAYEKGVWSDISTATRKAIHGPSPSYVLVAGLHAALKALFEEGLEVVYRRHETASRAVREGVRAMGLGVLAKEEVAAPISTRLVFTKPIDWTTLAATAFKEYNIALASGFRIGTMGQSANPTQVLEALRGLEKTLRALGHPVTSGVDAAQSVFDAC